MNELRFFITHETEDRITSVLPYPPFIKEKASAKNSYQEKLTACLNPLNSNPDISDNTFAIMAALIKIIRSWPKHSATIISSLSNEKKEIFHDLVKSARKYMSMIVQELTQKPLPLKNFTTLPITGISPDNITTFHFLKLLNEKAIFHKPEDQQLLAEFENHVTLFMLAKKLMTNEPITNQQAKMLMQCYINHIVKFKKMTDEYPLHAMTDEQQPESQSDEPKQGYYLYKQGSGHFIKLISEEAILTVELNDLININTLHDITYPDKKANASSALMTIATDCRQLCLLQGLFEQTESKALIIKLIMVAKHLVESHLAHPSVSIGKYPTSQAPTDEQSQYPLSSNVLLNQLATEQYQHIAYQFLLHFGKLAEIESHIIEQLKIQPHDLQVSPKTLVTRYQLATEDNMITCVKEFISQHRLLQYFQLAIEEFKENNNDGCEKMLVKLYPAIEMCFWKNIQPSKNNALFFKILCNTLVNYIQHTVDTLPHHTELEAMLEKHRVITHLQNCSKNIYHNTAFKLPDFALTSNKVHNQSITSAIQPLHP